MLKYLLTSLYFEFKKNVFFLFGTIKAFYLSSERSYLSLLSYLSKMFLCPQIKIGINFFLNLKYKVIKKYLNTVKNNY